MQIFSKYCFLNLIIKNICCCLFKSLFNWSPHFFTSFSKPAGIPTDSSENSTASVMGFNWYPNINQKWNWFQIFLSEIHESPKNGSWGVFFLISGFLKGLRHSAMERIKKTLLKSYRVRRRQSCCFLEKRQTRANGNNVGKVGFRRGSVGPTVAAFHWFSGWVSRQDMGRLLF